MVVKHSQLVRQFTMPTKNADKLLGRAEQARADRVLALAGKGKSEDEILEIVFAIPTPEQLERMAKREALNAPPASHSLAAAQPSEVYRKRRASALAWIRRIVGE